MITGVNIAVLILAAIANFTATTALMKFLTLATVMLNCFTLGMIAADNIGEAEDDAKAS